MNSPKDFDLFFKNHKSSIQNLVLLSLVFGSIVLFVHQSVQLNKNEIWFSNLDMDSTVLIESLRVNSGREPQFTLDPALGNYILYGKSLRLFKALNLVPVSEFNQLEASSDPLMLLPDLFYKGRTISIIIAIFCAFIFGFIFYILTRKFFIFSISIILFLFSGGLLLQSLILRSELTSVFFILLSLLLLIIHSKSKKPSYLTVITAGVLFGAGMLSKIQVWPILLFMIILLFYIVFKKLKKSPEGLLKHRFIHFFFTIIILIIYLYFVNLIYPVNSEYASIPTLLLIFILLILLSSMISTLLWFKQTRFSSFLNHTNLFLIGFLISFLIIIYLTNIKTDNTMRGIFDLVFQSGSHGLLTQKFLHSMDAGISSVLSGFMRFLRYYLSETYFLIFLFLFFLLTGFNYKAIITFIFGVGYWFFSSLRHFGPHYLIYSDIFLNATLILILILFLSPELKEKKYYKKLIKLQIRYILIITMLCFLGLFQFNYVKKAYPELNEALRNRIDLIPYLSPWPGNKEYSKMMIKKYKHVINIIDRVYNDPYLNGSEDGIDITEKINYKILGWIALPEVHDINLKLSEQDIIKKEILDLLKNLYQVDKDKFNEVKERFLKKRLGWSDDDVERRITREIPSHLTNFRMNNKVELLGYDLTPMAQSRLEITRDEKNTLKSESKPERKEKNELSNKLPILKLGERFEIIFYWKCLEKIDHEYAIWGGLGKGPYDIIELAHILADDSEYPTTAWKPGELIKEICRYRVPDYFDPGEYDLYTSLYDIDEEREVSETRSLGKVKVLRPLEGAIERVREYGQSGSKRKLQVEYTEIIKHINGTVDPEKRILLSQTLRELEAYRLNDPQNIDVNYAIGMGYEKLGNLKKAEEILNNVLEKDINHTGALFLLGKIYYAGKRYPSAAEFLEKVPLDQESNFEAGLLLKKVYDALGNQEKAPKIDRQLRIISENSIKRAKWSVKGIGSSDPELPWAYSNIGIKFILYGDFSTLVLRVLGEEAGNVFPFLTVWIDGRILHEGYMKNGEWNDYEFSIKGIEPGQHLLKIWKTEGGPLHLGKLSFFKSK